MKSFAYRNILIELSKGRKLSGYDIIVHVKSFGFKVSAGTVYHQLSLLSKDGIIRGKRQNKKTVYEMTDKGFEVFEEFKEKWKKPLEHVVKAILSEKE